MEPAKKKAFVNFSREGLGTGTPTHTAIDTHTKAQQNRKGDKNESKL